MEKLSNLITQMLVTWLDLKAAELRWFSDKSQYERGYWDGYRDSKENE